jgi:hypothetical protein
VPGMFVCRSHLVECGGEGLIACSFCLRVCCVVHLYCPCDRAAARRSYVIINDAMMAAARASEWARKAKMAADRAGTAARSMELAGFGGLVFGLGPFMAPTINSRVGVPVLGLSGPTVAPIHNNNLILSGPVPTRVHAPALGPVPASVLGPTVAATCVIPLPAASGSGPAAAPLDNINIGPSATGFGPIAAPVFNIHVLAPGTREPPPRTAVPAPVSGTAAPICGPAFPDISIPIPEVVEESSCLSPGPRFNGSVDPELQIWPLCLAPDWPILDSWRDFAFSTITLRPSSDSPGESSSDSKGR